MAPEHFYINYLSVNGGLVSSKQGVKVWTELLIPEEVEDILVLPGGRTATKLLCLEPKKLEIIKAAAQEADICMMIANASSILAQTGLLIIDRLQIIREIRTGNECLLLKLDEQRV